jgi:hypothetical protein
MIIGKIGGGAVDMGQVQCYYAWGARLSWDRRMCSFDLIEVCFVCEAWQCIYSWPRS